MTLAEVHGVDEERGASLSTFSMGLTVLLSHRILSYVSIISLIKYHVHIFLLKWVEMVNGLKTCSPYSPDQMH